MAPEAQRSRPGELAFLAIGGACVLMTAIGLLRVARPRQVLSWARSAIRAAEGTMRQEPDKGEIGRVVRERMRATKLVHLKKAFAACCACLSLLTVVMLANLVRGVATRTSATEDAVHLSGNAILALVTLCPRVVSWKTADFIYGIVLLLGAVYVSPLVDEPDKVLPRILMVNLPVLFLNVVRGRLRVVLLANLPYAIASSVSIYMHWTSSQFRAEVLIITQLAFLSLFPYCAHWIEVSTAAAMRQGLEAQAATELLSAATALLRSYCDVVVEVDIQGVIRGPAEDLSTFLLRGPSCRLTGTHLSDLMVDEEERWAFQRRLVRVPGPHGGGLADSIHVHMRDGNNALLQVEVTSFDYSKVDSQRCTMVGLREFSDASPASLPRSQQASSGRLPPLPARLPPPPPLPPGEWRPPGVEAPASCHIRAEWSSSEEGSMGPGGLADPPMEAALFLDSSREGLPVRGYSSGFRRRLGRLGPGLSLLDIVQEAEAFAEWLGAAVRPGSEEAETRLTFLVRRGNFRATCRVAREADGRSINHQCVQLLLREIRRCHARQGRAEAERPPRAEDPTTAAVAAAAVARLAL